eukprot:505368-Hanusia_phi.AAC.2
MANKRKVDAKNLNPDDSSKYLALFFANAALLQPLEISLPLTEEVFMKLFSARDAFIEKALASYSLHTLRHKGKRQEMEIRLSQKEEKTRDLMLKACKEGKGVYRSRLGLDLAMFEALSKEEQEKGLKSGRERLDKMKVNKETLMEMMSAKLKQEDEKLLSVKNVEDWFIFLPSLHSRRANRVVFLLLLPGKVVKLQSYNLFSLSKASETINQTRSSKEMLHRTMIISSHAGERGKSTMTTVGGSAGEQHECCLPSCRIYEQVTGV